MSLVTLIKYLLISSLPGKVSRLAESRGLQSDLTCVPEAKNSIKVSMLSLVNLTSKDANLVFISLPIDSVFKPAIMT